MKMAESCPNKWKTLSKQIENALGKGEIACYEQFVLFPQYFQKTCIADTENPGLVCERVKSVADKLDIK